MRQLLRCGPGGLLLGLAVALAGCGRSDNNKVVLPTKTYEAPKEDPVPAGAKPGAAPKKPAKSVD